ncbi:type I-U CRISPR-associated protein Csb2, partial [bacterium]|nr:type I-U CRISPR-associated protein Csb2 [bacterium]
LGIGHPSDFGGLNEQKGQCPVLASSSTWVSRTPFVPTDHLRIRNSEKTTPDGYAKALQRELESVLRKEMSRRPWLKEHPNDVKIEIIPHTFLGGTETTWLKFIRKRKNGGGAHSTSLGYGFRLNFPESVQGPIILGYGSHFGLGQFVPEDG